MKKSEWSDKQLEELLEQLPQVKDRQSPEELYRKINARLQDEQVRKKSTKTWMLPSVAAVAAVLLIIVIGPSFLNLTGGSSQENASEESVSEGEMASLNTAEEKGATSLADEEEAGITSTEESTDLRMPTSEINHVLTGTNGTYVTIGIMNDQASNLVPITFVSEDSNVSRVDLLEQVLDQLPYGDFGLIPTPLSELMFKEIDGNRIEITFPNAVNATGAALSNEYYKGIEEVLRWMGYSAAVLRMEDGSEVEIGEYGNIPSIDSPTSSRGYFLYTNGAGSTYLVPGNSPSTTMEEALEIMKINDGLLEPSIPTDIIIEDITEVDKDRITVTFSPDSNVNQENISHELMIKAILLTAKEFGYADVTFVNTSEEIGGLPLQVNGQPNPIPVPAAPNHIDFPITN
ncbi:hypothetical protein [Bacillus sp. AK128]